MTTPPTNRGKTKSPVKEFVKQHSTAPIRLKTVIRRLPPNLPEAIFWQSVQPWVSDETASWRIFYQGKLRKRPNKENIPSRAYILFKNEEHLAIFSREYDGHLFRDKQGSESHAIVEFAPNQKVPPEKKKVDSRHATIHQDEDYLSFVASLQDPPAKAVEVDVDALLASTLPPEEPKSTPLLDALREQKLSAQEKKLAASETSKTHPRKGTAAAVPSQKSEAVDAAPPPGKKGKKGKGVQSGGPAVSTPTVTNPSKSSGRNRPGPSQAPNQNISPAATSSTGPSTGKEAVALGDGEPPQRRNRPMLGLQSRHLKAALSGAGVSMAPASPSSSPVSTALPATVVPANAGTSSGPSAASATRGSRGRGSGEKRPNEQIKDGAAKGSGGGRGGGGKDKSRSRHPPAGQGTPAASVLPADVTPRILSRQDPPLSALNAAVPPPRGRVDVGSGRGRGRRGRG